jgi:AhpD family alkylhydroperoxidase
VFLGLSALWAALDRKASPIDSVLRALITVRVSQINWCPFCVDLNSASVLKRGGTAARLRDLERFRESAEFSETEKAALAYAEAMTIGNEPVEEAVFEEVRRHFDEDTIVELTGLIAFQNLSSRFNAALDVKPQGFCGVAPQPRRISNSQAAKEKEEAGAA